MDPLKFGVRYALSGRAWNLVVNQRVSMIEFSILLNFVIDFLHILDSRTCGLVKFNVFITAKTYVIQSRRVSLSGKQLNIAKVRSQI